MALVRKMKQVTLDHISDHSEVECTFSIVLDGDGQKSLQLDTYGSKERQIVGKKSQSIRLAPEALQQLKVVLAENGL